MQACKISHGSDKLEINNTNQTGLKRSKYGLIEAKKPIAIQYDKMESNGKKERTHKREDILRIGENFVIYQSNASFLRVVDVILYGPNNWYHVL